MLIQFDYYGAMRQAGRVEEAAEDILRLADSQIEMIIEELSVYWQGASADLYFSKCRELQSALRNTSRDLDTVAGNIRARSARMREAELMAQQIAQNTDH
ncbi:MAG: hypothetical protein E7434_01920 [Ruminococcaceae bacterium]|nr:hypothetical protein [Oscillospiraceae bacterium]